MDFKIAISDLLQQRPQLKQILAEKFEVAISTPDRWASGIAIPHPKVQQRVLEFIQQHTSNS